MSFGSSKKTTESSFQNQQDPWDEVVPYLKDWLGKVGSTGAGGTVGATPGQQAAFDELKGNAGNPLAGEIGQLAKDQLNTADNTGMVRNGYSDLTRRLSATADGSNLDLSKNTYLQSLLTQVGDDAQNRVNASFAAAGRDFSGANQGAVARGVTSAQAPLLLDMFKSEQGRTDAAARDLFSASGQTAGTIAQLDKSRSDLRTQGAETSKAAMEARDAGANTRLRLEQQLKDLPYQDLAQLAQLLFPAAQLGGQSSGTGTSTTKGTKWGFELKDIGKIATGIGTLF